MKNIRIIFISLAIMVASGWYGNISAQETEGIDSEALIERILAIDKQQREKIHDVTFDAEYVEGEKDKQGTFKEKVKFIKKVYIKYVDDTVLYHEKYIEFYKDGKLKSPQECKKEATKRIEKKKKRKMRDISYNMLNPFYPKQSKLYQITYRGVAEDKINGYVCHHFTVKALLKSDSLINGDYYFEAESFHLVKVDFSPAKLVKKTMFKMNKLNMSILYAPTKEGYWLPRQFDIEGKGKAMFFIGVKFAGTEYYRNPIINSGLSLKMFEDKQ